MLLKTRAHTVDTKCRVGKPEGDNHLGEIDIDGRVLEYILRKQDVRVWARFMWLKIGTSGGLYKCDGVSSVCIKGSNLG